MALHQLILTELKTMIKEVVSESQLSSSMMNFLKLNRPKLGGSKRWRDEDDEGIVRNIMQILEIVGQRTSKVDEEYSLRTTFKIYNETIEKQVRMRERKFTIQHSTNSQLANQIFDYLESLSPDKYSKRILIDKEIANHIVGILATAGSRTEHSESKYSVARAINKIVSMLTMKIDMIDKEPSYGGYSPNTMDIRFVD